MSRVLVPVDGGWQTGDVVKTCYGYMGGYMTLDRDGWRESTPEEKRAYESLYRGIDRVSPPT